MLYTIKQFANGKPKDNKATLVYDLKFHSHQHHRHKDDVNGYSNFRCNIAGI